RDEYFCPSKRLSAHCTGGLQAPSEETPSPPPDATKSADEAAKANEFRMFHADVRARPPGAPPAPLTVMVPAGGVFLGIFQVGALAALKAYDLMPDLYAGASVGTLFSYVLSACLREGEGHTKLEGLVRAIETVPQWVDA